MFIPLGLESLLLILLPVAAASGWYAAQRSHRSTAGRLPTKPVRADYFKGIHYLLYEQPDKAIEAFIKVLEVEGETAETHLALGNLYRRRGEMERAIRIHQNLVMQSALNSNQRHEALLELGQDYLTAGLLDRAESLFQELVESGYYTVQALRQLIEIYEQEKDWDKAIDSARKFEGITGNQLGGVIAHYYCEKAEQSLRDGGRDAAVLDIVGQALDAHNDCVRASLIEGDVLIGMGNLERALQAYRRVEVQDPDYLSEAIDRMYRCYGMLEKPEHQVSKKSHTITEFFSGLLRRYTGVSVTVALSEIKRKEGSEREALAFLTEKLRERPSLRGYQKLLEMELHRVAPGDASDHFLILKDLVSSLLKDRPIYQCCHCGFPARLLYWQCPGCKNWSTIKPIQGVEGE
uniref:Lipopolysaccharide assembly protein B n=1 Tax=Candidatus Kentrum sp. FM TaxID=2126340 RepID=A0A450THN4_9GAMM|nr:MAG: Lipopolysaccharide biosynthesis regulator YciM, contains six TPR domains and a predicted metal-binding C-terminal domain [Candidatus Kentron sp. FM]VFJ70393.1 MAG: Lipopolysaccharide biosynthesis regulator YciM, contains six TPR domains and a predicted metal-binding C-terminal domain [Candidatus Kentron sp. FM]VFK08304.1 MAG: Lipopolysaccharide biosynthesis regulator YciM, contains six TPR domains and a predicted metal-binding C-terminal domain [Candidatus Kentron sp. FM]